MLKKSVQICIPQKIKSRKGAFLGIFEIMKISPEILMR